MISCLLLSAGLSSRYGSAKALVKINGQTIIERLQNMLVESPIDEIIIVLGAHKEQIKPFILKHKNVKFVYNKDYNFGQTSSFQAGIRSIHKDSDAVMLLPVDYPFIDTKTINSLISFYIDNAPTILIPTYHNQKGHPPIFSSVLKKEFLDLSVDKGINTVSHRYQPEVVCLPVEDKGILQTFNTKEELEVLKQELFKNNSC